MRKSSRRKQRAALLGTTAATAAILMTMTAHSAMCEQSRPEPAEKTGSNVHTLDHQAPQTAPVTQEQPVYYDIPLSEDLQDFVFEQAEAQDVPAALIFAMMDQESGYQADLVSSTADWGIMQINEINHATLRETLGVEDFLDPRDNIRAGAYIIGEKVEKYNGDIEKALTSYNRGDRGARRWAEIHGTWETEYSRSVLEIYKDLTTGEREEL